MHKLKNCKKFNIMALLKCFSVATKFNNGPKKRMNYYNIWYIYRVLFFKYILKGLWLQMKFSKIFLGEVHEN